MAMGDRGRGVVPWAEIRSHSGTPTLFVDGEPTFAGVMLAYWPEPDRYPAKAVAEHFAAAGTRIFSFDVGTGGTEEWCGPGPSRSEHWDFSQLEARYRRVLETFPEARFHLRVQLEMGRHAQWWQDLFPEECELGSDGERICQSYASQVWYEQAADFLRGYVETLRAADLLDRVIAYQVCAGSSAEWVKGDSSMDSRCADYSRPMQRYFRTWLRHRYQDEVEALREAWADTEVSFDTALVPSPDEQLSSSFRTLRHPAREGKAIDYFRCYADLCAERVIGLCQVVKEATGGRALAGAFFGYLMELSWNKSFFSIGDESGFASYQRSGHLGLGQILRSPHVDFVASPYSYGFRAVGGHGPGMPPSESLRLHGKLYYFEEDTRTYLAPPDAGYGRSATLADSEAVLKRNLAEIVTRGQAIWWCVNSHSMDPEAEPAFGPLLERFHRIGAFSLGLDRRPQSQIAVLIDDESFFFEGSGNDLDLPLIFQQRLWGLPRLGAPADYYLLQDLLEGSLPPYKLYLLLNPWCLSDQRREALARQLRRDGRVALWIYAPGFLKDEPDLAHMEELTGFRFGQGDRPWGPLIQVEDYGHPITESIPPDLFWGTNGRLGPLFHLEDPEARILGQVVYSEGQCRPGFAVKEFPAWRSVYAAAPNLPAPILRGLARYAGVHLYSEAGDVLYATPQLLVVHTLPGGQRDFCLPEKVEVVYDLFAGVEVAAETDEFAVVLPERSTTMWFTGERRELALFDASGRYRT